VEGTLSQGVREFGLRRCRYIGLAKARLQHVATAAAINVNRISDWLGGVPRAATRTSRFARLAACSEFADSIQMIVGPRLAACGALP
jgi:transposase